jgi:hypothetical protein
MGRPLQRRNKGQEHRPDADRFYVAKEAPMAEDREKISTGPNEEPVNETIAGTGPGIPDDALAPGEKELPQAPSDEEVEEMAEKLHAPSAEKDTLPLEGE